MSIPQKIRTAFGKIEDSYQRSAIQDLFALGCYLHAMGDCDAGLKTCATALRAIRVPNTTQIAVFKYVPGHERECFEAAWAHSELKSLLKAMPQHADEPASPRRAK